MYESSKLNCTSFFPSKCTKSREKYLKEKLFLYRKLTQNYIEKH